MLVWGSVSRADVTVEACSDAYTKGQEERLAGRLFSARAQFHICDDSTCPNAIVQDCRRWTAEVEADLPTITVKAANLSGDRIENLNFWVDGTLVPRDELERPVVVDAGPHVFRFEAPGFEPVQLERSMEPENRGVAVEAVLHPLSKPPTPSAALQEHALQQEPPAPRPSKAFPVAAATLTGVGVVALGGALYFGLSAQHQFNELKDGQDACAPTCTPAQRKSVDNKALISDIALGVSAVAFGAAAWVFFSSGPDPQAKTALGLEPRPDGARMRLNLAF